MANFCHQCGKRLDGREGGVCPDCGAALETGSKEGPVVEGELGSREHRATSSRGISVQDVAFGPGASVKVGGGDDPETLSDEGGTAGADSPAQFSAKVGDLVMGRDSRLTITGPSTTIIQKDAWGEKVAAYRALLSNRVTNQESRMVELHSEELIQEGERLGLPRAECVRQLHEFGEAMELACARERQAKRYRVRRNRHSPAEGVVSMAELVQWLNAHAKLKEIPEVEMVGTGVWRPVWNMDEVFYDPELQLVCAQTLQPLQRQDAVRCGKCRAVYHRQFLGSGGLCRHCTPKPDALEASPLHPSGLFIRSGFDSRRWKELPPGRFQMGSPVGEREREADEALHWVTLTRGLLVHATPVTEKLYAEVRGTGGGREDYAQTQVSWYDAVGFCNALSRSMGLLPCYEIGEAAPPGKHPQVRWRREIRGVRLLTEAEWEYACRGGGCGASECADPRKLLDHAVYDTEEPEPVGVRKPNGFGLHDMLGSVWEWVWDCRHEYPHVEVADPATSSDGWQKVLRGGSFGDPAARCRCAQRFYAAATAHLDTFGFRIAVTV